MELKDYYAILELQPPVSQTQIKKAYRRLAHIYHPDKSHTDPYAQARFADIKEAYEVLTHPEKREKYLQLRWLNSSMGKKASSETTTPVSLLKLLLSLEKRLAGADQFRMDREGLYTHLDAVFSAEHTTLLSTFGDEAINQEIIAITLRCMRFLPFEKVAPVADKLRKITGDKGTHMLIDNYLASRKRTKRNETWEVPVMILIVAAICLLIYFSSR